MDIAAWQSLFQEDPTAAANEFQRRQRENLPASQHAAVWSWTAPDNVWEPPALHTPLTGVPFATKDLFHQAGAPTRAGGRLPARPQRSDGRLVAALRSVGAVPVGKTHLHEFAYGLTGENPHFGNVVHPHDADRTSGGSSSGSAAAVAAGIVPFALGTDTGGSLRVPAAFCGLYSWRDEPGNPWIHDAFPLAPSFDTAGWLTRSAHDIRSINTALRGALPTSPRPPRGAYLDAAALGLAMDQSRAERLATVAARFDAAPIAPSAVLAATFTGSGAAYGILQSTEAYAVHQAWLDSRRADYGEAVWQRIDRGRRWTAAQLDQARVQTMRIKLAFERFFATHDFLVMPVSPTPALRHAECDQPHRDALLTLTTPASLAGLPVLTVPVPLADGLSLGLQFIFPQPHGAALDAILARCETCSPLAP